MNSDRAPLKTPLRAVIFDFGNVLCFPPTPEKIQRAADVCRLSVRDFWEKFWQQRLDYDAGLVEPLPYWTGVVGEEFAAARLDELVELEVDFWNQYDERPFAWIAKLRAQGIRVGILSNLPRVLGEALKGERFLDKPFLDHFDHVTFSYELKVIKPEASIYRHAFEGLGVAPGEALFIDDKMPNVEGAAEVGLRAELFDTWEEFIDRDVPSKHHLPDAG